MPQVKFNGGNPVVFCDCGETMGIPSSSNPSDARITLFGGKCRVTCSCGQWAVVTLRDNKLFIESHD